MLYSRSFVKTGNKNLTQWKKAVYSKEYKIVLGSYIAYYFTLQGRNSYKSPSFIDLEGSFYLIVKSRLLQCVLATVIPFHAPASYFCKINGDFFLYVRVTVHRNKFLYNKTN